MQLKKNLCLLMACTIVLGCFSISATAVDIKEQTIEVSEIRAMGHFDFEIPANTLMRASSNFPMEYGESVTITALYTPTSANLDYGLIDPNGTFHFRNISGGSIDETVRIDKKGTYTFAIRNNSDYDVHISGFINY